MRIRTPALALVLVAACGDGKTTTGDANTADVIADSAPTVDAPPLPSCTPVSGTNISMRKIGNVSGSALLAVSPPHDGRLFVVEQDGRIRIFENEQLRPTPFLDISNKISGGSGSEQGFLGLAFHPDYAHNNYFYVDYTTGNCSPTCTNTVVRYTASATDLNVADPASAQVVLTIPDFATNHNGGMMEFGPDGFLYISTGDGGGGGDPNRNGQAIDRTAASCTVTGCEPLLGKMLRLDVDHPANGKNYGIPLGNPFAAGGGEPEIFLVGLRNPWRWSFDKMTGDLWIGDVGQGKFEEIDMLPAGQQVGKNLGWSVYEANSCYNSPLQGYTCPTTGITFPVVERTAASNWHAIIGGEVYRGTCYPDLVGTYLYTDEVHPNILVKGKMTGTTFSGTDVTGSPAFPSGPSSIHADSRGELYETTVGGGVYHIEAGP